MARHTCPRCEERLTAPFLSCSFCDWSETGKKTSPSATEYVPKNDGFTGPTAEGRAVITKVKAMLKTWAGRAPGLGLSITTATRGPDREDDEERRALRDGL